MGGRKSYLFLWGLLLLIASACGVDSADSFNFTELRDLVFEVEVEVNERDSNMTEIRCVHTNRNVYIWPCPVNILQLIGKMKLMSIKQEIKDSKERSLWWANGAFMLDLYFTVMEISFVKGEYSNLYNFIILIFFNSQIPLF
jgi:hypothetical protein